MPTGRGHRRRERVLEDRADIAVVDPLARLCRIIAPQECLPTNEARDAFAADFSVLARIWEAPLRLTRSDCKRRSCDFESGFRSSMRCSELRSPCSNSLDTHSITKEFPSGNRNASYCEPSTDRAQPCHCGRCCKSYASHSPGTMPGLARSNVNWTTARPVLKACRINSRQMSWRQLRTS